MQAKLVKIDIIVLCESTFSFRQAWAKLLIAHNLCSSSVDLRGHVTDGKKNLTISEISLALL